VAVIQISRIQIRRGHADNLPDALEEGEFALTTDTGELFVGAPSLPKIQNRAGSIYPYRNIRVLTEFDVVRTLSDHVVTHTPLQRIVSPQRANDAISAWTFRFNSGSELPVDGSGNSTTRLVTLTWNGSGTAPGDLRGRVVQSVTRHRSSTNTGVSAVAFTVVHPTGTGTDSTIVIALDDASNINTVLTTDTFVVQFYNLDTVVDFPLAEADSFVMDYSMRAESGSVPARRTGTLYIAADEYSVGISDTGVDINQAPASIMRVVWSGHIENRSGELWIVLTLTNLSTYPVSITFAGNRWSHSSE
jgi:hypothetical protein